MNKEAALIQVRERYISTYQSQYFCLFEVKNHYNPQSIDNRDYLSLSDMAKEDGGIERIRNWMRNRDTIEFLATWEQIHNPDLSTRVPTPPTPLHQSPVPTKCVRTIEWILRCQRINTQESPQPWIMDPVFVINRVARPLDLLILSLEAKSVRPNTRIPAQTPPWNSHSKE